MDIEHIKHPNGRQEWKLKPDGCCHREDGPAIIFPDGEQEWWLNGRRHREDGPAVIYLQNGGLQEWWINGLLHREDGPAVIYNQGRSQSWWFNGNLHRIDGPAVIDNYIVAYYINGVRIKEEPYNIEIHDKYRFKNGSKTKAAPREYLQ